MKARSTGGADAGKLKQQLHQAKSDIADLQEELEEKNNLYRVAVEERNKGKA